MLSVHDHLAPMRVEFPSTWPNLVVRQVWLVVCKTVRVGKKDHTWSLQFSRDAQSIFEGEHGVE